MIRIKRAYEAASPEDGERILVDRLWPRGISKEKAKIDRWMKDIAPSNELRKRFHHEAENWDAFVRDYRKELGPEKELLAELAELARSKTVTLVYGAKNEVQNQAVVLKELLDGHQEDTSRLEGRIR